MSARDAMLTDEQWAKIEPLIPKEVGCIWDIRQYAEHNKLYCQRGRRTTTACSSKVRPVFC